MLLNPLPYNQNSEVDREIAEIEHNIQKQRKTMGGVHNSHLRHLTTQHNIKVIRR